MGKKIKIGLVLSGGGARGLAHLGLLKEFEKENIQIDYIMGVSMGAIIGALYAFYQDADQVIKIVRDFTFSEEFNKTRISEIQSKGDSDDFWGHFAKKVKQQIVINVAAYKISLAENGVIENILRSLFKDIRQFDELKIPFSCVASDLISGEEIVFDKDNLIKALVASSSIPGYLPPQSEDTKLFVDGSVSNNIPADLIRKKYRPDIVIVSDVSESINKPFNAKSIYDIIVRSSNVTQNQYRKHLLKYSDVTIDHDTGNYPWYVFHEIDRIISIGETSASTKTETIRKLIKEKSSISYRFKQMFNTKSIMEQ